MNIITQLITYKKKFATYSIGLLQARSYRILKQKTNAFLHTYELSTLDWALLGILFESKESPQLSHLAHALGVKAPLVSRLIKKLEEKEFIVLQKNDADPRVKTTVLTKKGETLVKTVEAKLRAESKSWIKGVSARDFLAYMRVLEAINNIEDTKK